MRQWDHGPYLLKQSIIHVSNIVTIGQTTCQYSHPQHQFNSFTHDLKLIY